jgi:HPt (histidine-containing phosphotransfer) domain-containing protein
MRSPLPAAPVVFVESDLADLIPSYLSHRWADLAMAHKLLQAQDYERLARMGHRIRGSASPYGFGQLGEIAATLETAARQRDRAGLMSQLARFDSFLRTVRIEYI